jgi:hypothetical protein
MAQTADNTTQPRAQSPDDTAQAPKHPTDHTFKAVDDASELGFCASSFEQCAIILGSTCYD